MTSKVPGYIDGYEIEPATVAFKDGQLSANIVKTTPAQLHLNFPLTVSFLESGAVRISIDEELRQKGQIELRHGRQIRKERYNEAANHAVVGGLNVNKSAKLIKESGQLIVEYGPNDGWKAVIQLSPFRVDFFKDGKKHITLNDRSFMNIEHWRPKNEDIEDQERQEHPTSDGGTVPKEYQTSEVNREVSYDESTWWDESFGSHTDTKPRGPESIGLDITFENYGHVYGIPGHAGPLSLRQTGPEQDDDDSHGYRNPYRLFNADVFEYELDKPMTLYGAIPFMQAHRKDSTVGVFWLSAAETWIDIKKEHIGSNPLAIGVESRTNTQTHWFSESGIMDMFVFMGEKPQDIIQKYTELTGYTTLPPAFSLGYHQCRWNYMSDDELREVDRKMDRYNIPFDVIWLDVDWSDHRKYFEWNKDMFPDPLGTQKQLDSNERKLVMIVDPHVKAESGYYADEELKSKHLAILNKDGSVYSAHCWPGESHWIDCFNPKAIEWWKTMFQYDRFKGTSEVVHLWNDMNEPSVFGGPETSMQRDNIHYGSWEHRDVHNINGMTYHNATYQALIQRKKGEQPQRPFVLTRSFYSGSQRYGAVWTGDNQANWGHLAAGFPMILSLGVAGYPFAGADVGGFFGNPSKDLQTRWYQAGAFYPFFRAHAHDASLRREPYLLGDPYTAIMTDAIRFRYSLLPAWYTAFHEASVQGSPVIRPQYYVHPEDERGFEIDDQLYLGSTGILAKPVVTEGADLVEIYISDDAKYYDYFDYTIYQGAGRHHKISAPLEKIPVLMQAGHIIPRKDRHRRSSGQMKWDPYTLVITPGRDGRASGSLYVDDGKSFDYQKGAYIHRGFTLEKSVLTSSNLGVSGAKTNPFAKNMIDNKVRVEKIIIVDPPQDWQSKKDVLVVTDGAKAGSRASVVFSKSVDAGQASSLVIRNPDVLIASDWKIDLS